MPSRYQPLADYLAGLPPETGRITLTFPEMEAILGGELPAGAAVRSWWEQLTRGPAWRAAGWRLVGVRLRAGHEWVTFARSGSTQ